MACEKRPYLCAILVLCLFALFFHIVGFVAPGWIILRRSVGDDSLFPMEGKPIDDGGLPAPQPEDDEPRAMFRKKRSHDDDTDSSEEGDSRSHHGPHHGGHHGPHHGGHNRPHHGSTRMPPSEMNEDMRKENSEVGSWMMKTAAEIESFDVRTSYGLWYSVMCIHKRRMDGDSDSDDKDDMAESSRESSSEDDDRKKRHHCKKMSTKCALSYASMYEDFMYVPRHGERLSYKSFGMASLKEHQIESCLVLAFMVLGLISAVVGFKNANGCRCARLACVIFMLLAAFIAIVPVARLGHYSVHRAHQKSMIKVHAPYSVIASLIGAIFAFTAALVAGCALYKTRKNQAGKWYQFNNELETPNEEKNAKPALYYSTDPLPAKPGLYDVCDFSNIKPVEEIKKPEKEEPDEFVL
ncbi:uncharacterized protein LOC132750940 [Ruditapes philippinarum]|uniref:uncharacterized protein LOC132750940 n=1 Tax=Ruditapes philippinarum TaxID=129788 RepID=UPI00295C3505|nr:uncharacterized protein LOC132750940 [Ruditapes philippinarum]